MKKFYSVDRVGTLQEGMVIVLMRYSDVSPPFLQTHVDYLFPDGLSMHGERYLINNNSKGNIASPAIELLFENVRRANFSECPSRFQSFFACCSIEEARTFRNTYGSNDSQIFEVYTENRFFKANMCLLGNNHTNLVCSYLAHEYWAGNSGPPELSEFTEILLELPVTIGPKIG